MSSLISLQKRVGNGHSRSSANLSSLLGLDWRSVAIPYISVVGFLCLALVRDAFAHPAQPRTQFSPTSRAAAERCRVKMKGLEDFDALKNTERVRTTKFSEEEVNSYLSEELDSEASPSLKRLAIVFKKNWLKAVATIDFDNLRMTSPNLVAKIAGLLFSGIHTLTAEGRIVSGNGNAHFELEQALFDNHTLPRPLVEEIITAVGQKQNPPFDPLQPSKLLYNIDRIEVRPGYIVVHQKTESRSPSP